MLILKDKEDLILKTTQVPTYRQRVFNEDALYYWMLALEQEEWALNRLETIRPSKGRKG